MTFPSPKKPDVLFPPSATVKICNAAGGDTFDPGEEVPIRRLMQMVVAALKALDNKEGSTIPEIKRLLCSAKLLNPAVDLRPAVICALKKDKIKRPANAVKSGIYGRYVLARSQPGASLTCLKESLQSETGKKAKSEKSLKSGKNKS